MDRESPDPPVLPSAPPTSHPGVPSYIHVAVNKHVPSPTPQLSPPTDGERIKMRFCRY